MSDPERILSGAGAGEDAELEYRLFASLRDVSPPPEAQAMAWDNIAHHLGAAGVGVAAGAAAHIAAQTLSQAPAAAPPLAAAAGKTFALGVFQTLAGKVAVGVAAVATLAAIGSKALIDSRPASNPAAPAAVTAPAMRAAVPSVPAAPAEPHVVDLPPAAVEATAVSKESTRGRQDERLREESALLTEARARLRNGNPRGALATLHTLDQRHPNGMLGQEREVLAIQALGALGESSAAQRRARAFVKAHPASPHAPLLRTFTGDP